MQINEAKIIRFVVLFGAGALFGSAIGFRIVMAHQEPLWFFGGITGGAAVGGLLSWRFGRRFWESIRYMRGGL